MPYNERDAAAAWSLSQGREAVSQMAAEIMREEAWWLAVRCGQYPQGTTVWADGAEKAPCDRPGGVHAGRGLDHTTCDGSG